MNGHPQFEEDFDLYALGALDPEEKVAIESHINSCADCAGKLATARGRIALLALATPPANPPQRVKERLIASVRQQSASGAAKRELGFRAFWHRPAAAWGLAAVAAIIALSFAVGNYRLHQEIREIHAEAQAQEIAFARARTVLDLLTASDTQRVTLTATSERPQPQGRIYYQQNRGLLFYAANLPIPPAGRTYQLWLVPAEGAPISAGVFEPDHNGNASIVLPNLPAGVAAKVFAVTVEPRGGVSQPTGLKVLVGAT